MLLFLLSFTLQAQENYANLEKNRNILAKGLVHELNKTKDTLILKSEKKINYLYSINKDYGRELDIYIDSTAYKMPLNKLSKGKHVFVAVQAPKRIIFVIRILKDFPEEQPDFLIAEETITIEPSEVTISEANN